MCIYTYMYIYLHIYTYIYKYIYLHIYKYTYMHVCSNIPFQIHMCIHAHSCTHVHKNIPTPLPPSTPTHTKWIFLMHRGWHVEISGTCRQISNTTSLGCISGHENASPHPSVIGASEFFLKNVYLFYLYIYASMTL